MDSYKKLCEDLRSEYNILHGEWTAGMMEQAADAIEELQAENERLHQKYIRSETDAINLTGECATLYAENARLKKKLDAAVADLRMCKRYKCDCCYYAENESDFAPCRDCLSTISNYGDGWKWRGMEVNDD